MLLRYDYTEQFSKKQKKLLRLPKNLNNRLHKQLNSEEHTKTGCKNRFWFLILILVFGFFW